MVFPCHPRTEKRLRKWGLWEELNCMVRVIKPVGYLDMLLLERNARAVIIDSGGVQKEAYMLKVPCVTMREETEWVETLKGGWNVLVGADRERILAVVHDARTSERVYGEQFGNGRAAEKIVELLREEGHYDQLVSHRVSIKKGIQ